MEVIIQPNAETASLLAAAQIARLLRKKPDAVLGLATGSTPLALYQELIRLHREQGLDFSAARFFNLDEYLGLGPDHPASYASFMRMHLFDPLGIDPACTHIPSGLVGGPDVEEHCAIYEKQIRNAGGIDLQVLGIGSDGHIGFNEPGSSLSSRTRIKTLTRSTREDNARFFSSRDEVPLHVITMGIGTIMEARNISLLAFGNAKADAVAGAVEGPITASQPASILQMHPSVKMYLDEPAAGKLQRTEYYTWVWDHKPAWQLAE
ncbi:MAG TPA: glucosamine-6-phosphate deaminase [Chthoniobacterales bacterium]|jgi:glucosamine-6-phosphate deaminase